jgi:hypothetical protein
MRLRLLSIGALALLAGLAAGLVVALLHQPAGARVDLGGRALSVRTELSPQDPRFGDTVVATVDAFVDRSRIDPGSVRVGSSFAPFAVVATSRSVHDAGGVSVVDVVRRLRCLELECVPRKTVKSFRFKPVRVSSAGGSATHAWPSLRVHSRVTKADVARPVLRVPPPVAAPVHYRVSPSATGYILLALAGLLAAAGAFLLLWVGLRRIAPAPRRVAPLDQVLEELAASCANGDSGLRRRALEELARELEPLNEPLSAESRVLAWGPGEPKPEAISDLTARVRGTVRR